MHTTLLKGNSLPLGDAGILSRAGAEQGSCVLVDTVFQGEHGAAHSVHFSLLLLWCCAATSRCTGTGHLLSNLCSWLEQDKAKQPQPARTLEETVPHLLQMMSFHAALAVPEGEKSCLRSRGVSKICPLDVTSFLSFVEVSIPQQVQCLFKLSQLQFMIRTEKLKRAQKYLLSMPKVITGDSDGSSFVSSTILTSWIVNVPVTRPSLLCERAQHPWVANLGQSFSLRLLTKALLSTQARSNVEIIKKKYVYLLC